MQGVGKWDSHNNKGLRDQARGLGKVVLSDTGLWGERGDDLEKATVLLSVLVSDAARGSRWEDLWKKRTVQRETLPRFWGSSERSSWGNQKGIWCYIKSLGPGSRILGSEAQLVTISWIFYKIFYHPETHFHHLKKWNKVRDLFIRLLWERNNIAS